jgi:hypothetical protein
MKFAFVYNKGKQVIRRSQPLAFLVFRPWLLIRTRYGWSLHILAFLNAVEINLDRFSYQGVISFGREYGQWFVGLTIGSYTRQLSFGRKHIIGREHEQCH